MNIGYVWRIYWLIEDAAFWVTDLLGMIWWIPMLVAIGFALGYMYRMIDEPGDKNFTISQESKIFADEVEEYVQESRR